MEETQFEQNVSAGAQAISQAMGGKSLDVVIGSLFLFLTVLLKEHPKTSGVVVAAFATALATAAPDNIEVHMEHEEHSGVLH